MANTAQQKLLLFFLSSVVLSPKPEENKQKKGKKEIVQSNLDVEDVMELMAQKAKNVDTTVKPLSFKWTMFKDKKLKSNTVMSQKDYLESLESIGTFASFPDFWSCWNKVQESFPKNGSKSECTYRLFKDGITPSWEDPANVKGGKFIVKMDRIRSNELLQKSFLSLIIALLIGELGHDSVCGAVLSIRPWGTLLSIWNNDANDRSKIKAVTQRLKELFGTSDIKYAAHQNSLKKLKGKENKSENESSASEDEAGTSQQKKSYLAALLATQQAVPSKVEKVVSSSRNDEPQIPALEIKESAQTKETEEKREQITIQSNDSEGDSEVENISNETVLVVQEDALKVEEESKVVSETKNKKKKNQKKKKSAKKTQVVPTVEPVVQMQPKVEENIKQVEIAVENPSSWWKVGLAATAASLISLTSAILLYTSS